jgi:flagellar biosynthesis protein FlhB
MDKQQLLHIQYLSYFNVVIIIVIVLVVVSGMALLLFAVVDIIWHNREFVFNLQE